MKNITLIIFLAAVSLFAGCSKDDMVSHETKAVVSDAKLKARVVCTDLHLLQLDCISSSGNANSAVTFTWNSGKLHYVFNRAYKSYIQIEGNAASSESIPIHLFTTSSHTHTKGLNEKSFKYRIVVLGYDRGEMACESMSPWQVFTYAN